MTAIATLLISGDNVVNKEGTKFVDFADRCAGKIIGLYFSAKWCPQCRDFTPELAKLRG